MFLKPFSIKFSIFVSFLLFSGCTSSKDEVWVSYNMQNFFDAYIDGSEHREFKNSTNWTLEKYQQKLINISSVLEALAKGEGSIGLMAVQEVENSGVLDDLIANTKALYGMKAIFTKKDGHPTGIGLLSRYPMQHIKVLDSSLFGIESRPVLTAEVLLPVPGKILHVIVCHLPSNLSKVNQQHRQEALLLIQAEIRTITDKNPQALIAVMGDFNQTFSVPSSQGLANDPFSLQLNNNVNEMKSYEVFNTWTYYNKLLHHAPLGSFFFQGQWEQIDYIFLSKAFFSGEAPVFKLFTPFTSSFLRFKPDNGPLAGPYRFDYNRAVGYSDHLPVLVKMRY